MAAVFPMHHKPYLDEWLPRVQRAAIGAMVADAIARDGSDPLLSRIVEELLVEPITLGARYHDPERWARTLIAGEADAPALRRGIYPGQRYQHHYDVYRLEVTTGLKMVSVGVNGGQLIDPEFVYLDGSTIVVRAANDAHRNEQIGAIEGRIAEANQTIERWNTSGLADAVRAEVVRRDRSRREQGDRIARSRAAGFEPTPPSKRQPLPLPTPRSRSRKDRPTTGRTPTGVAYNVTEAQFAEIVNHMAIHRDSVETLPGYGPPPESIEDRHRDALLGALNQSFHDASAETFSKKGRADIRIVVDDHSFFLAECKIWAGAETVSEAVDQLVERYMTYRDRYGAVVLFVRDVKRPEELPAKVIERMIDRHSGERLKDLHGVPVLAVETSAGRAVTLAVLMVVVDSAVLTGTAEKSLAE